MKEGGSNWRMRGEGGLEVEVVARGEPWCEATTGVAGEGQAGGWRGGGKLRENMRRTGNWRKVVT